MKTENEIEDRLKIYQNMDSKSKMRERLLFEKIEMLLWVLTCNDCKKYPCTCHDTF